jgi:hypothetical protein
MAKRDMIYDDCPEVPAKLIDTYDILQQLGLEFLIGRYKGIYKQLVEGEGMTAEKARIVAICHLIEENNRHLLIYLENELERPLRL